ncbi:MAG: hypothetical protein KUG72_10570 [Pseudomonadales bacterium]|nr:hypothetical protein [Pseudomonadales bacterium]
MHLYRAARTFRNTSVVVAICVLLGSCSTFQILYNQVDWLILNRADHYVDLNSSQRAILDKEVAELHEWHRTTQLPAYILLLEGLSIRTQEPLTDADFIWTENEMRALYFPLMEKVIPPVTQLLSTLDDEQIAYLKEQLDEDIEDKYEYLQYSQEDRLEYRIDKAIDQFEGGYGDLKDQQEQLIVSQVTKIFDTGALTKAHREMVNQQLIDLLKKHPSQQEIESHLHVIWLYPERNYTEEYQLSMDAAKNDYYEMMKGTHALASKSQIAYFNDQLLGYREDLVELSTPPEAVAASCKSSQPVSWISTKKSC